MIAFTCPNCRKSLRIAEEHAGKPIRCPTCQQCATVSLPAGRPGATGAQAPAASSSGVRMQWALVAVGFLGFGLAALGHHAIDQRWLTGAGFFVVAVAFGRGSWQGSDTVSLCAREVCRC
jgi:hypothetical protein